MTNEQTIDAIMGKAHAYADDKLIRYGLATMTGGPDHEARASELRNLIAAALAAKDEAVAAMEAESAAMADALKRIAESMGMGIGHTAEEIVAAVVALQPIKAIPAQGEWIEWQGGPIPDGVMHQVKFKNGDVSDIDSVASGWRWDSECADDDIVAYRVLP